MATLRIVFGLICLVGILGNRLPHGHLLKAQASASRLVAIAQAQVGVRESGGNNKGKEVALYLAYTNLKAGYPWCAALVSWVYGQAGYGQPRTAWSPALFPAKRKTHQPQTGDVFGIYFPQLQRIAHCGIIVRRRNQWFITIEGNTNGHNSRDGDGVYRKWRHRQTIATFARWLPQKGGNNE